MSKEANDQQLPQGELDPIWYAYLRSDGSFQGSGITKFDDAEFGSTDVPTPTYIDIEELPFFDVATNTWEVRVVMTAPDPEVNPGEEPV